MWLTSDVFELILGILMIIYAVLLSDEGAVRRLLFFLLGVGVVVGVVASTRGSVPHLVFTPTWLFYTLVIVAGVYVVGSLAGGIIAMLVDAHQRASRSSGGGTASSPAVAATSDGSAEAAATARPDFCRSCGAAVVDNTRFCIKCGDPLTAPTTPPVSPSPGLSARFRNPKVAVGVAVVMVCAVVLIGLAAGGVFSRGDDYDDYLWIADTPYEEGEEDSLYGYASQEEYLAATEDMNEFDASDAVDIGGTGDGMTRGEIVSLSGWGSAAELTVRDWYVVGDWAVALIDTTVPDLFDPDQPGMGCISAFYRGSSGWELYSEVSYMGLGPMVDDLTSAGVPSELVTWLQDTMAAGPVTDSTTTTAPAGWVCTPFGGTVTLPQGWTTAGPETKSTYIHYEAVSPEGMKIVFDTDLKGSSDPFYRAENQDRIYSEDATGHPGYQTVYLGAETYCGYEGARLEFVTDTNYVLDYHFLVPGQHHAACAAIYPRSWGEDARQEALGILDSFRVQ